MKYVKLSLSILGLSLVAAAPSARAQDNSTPPPPANNQSGEHKAPRGGRFSPEQRVAAIDQAVGGLTADEKTKILDILNTAQKDAQAARESGDRDKVREIMQSTNAKVREVLTPDQQTKFDAMPRPGRGPREKKSE